MDDIRLSCDDLILGSQLLVTLVLEVANGSRQIQVAIDSSDPTDFAQETACCHDPRLLNFLQGQAECS